MTKTSTFANVWDALEDSAEDAATMTMRSDVMIAIKGQVDSWNTTQARAARRLGITQPRLNDLLHGKINKFSLDTLTTLATRAGLKVRSRFVRPPEAQRGLGLFGARRPPRGGIECGASSLRVMATQAGHPVKAAPADRAG